MAERTGEWVALFSGGKDSAWALHAATERGLPLGRLLTMVPPAGSWLFHVPGTGWTEVFAEAIGLPLTRVEMPDAPDRDAEAAGPAGDREAAQLAAALDDVAADLEGGLAGIVSGAVASEFQHDRLEQLAADRGIGYVAPLWDVAAGDAARRMVAAGFDIRIVAVAAGGLDESWLGRRYDETAIAELETLADRYGIHLLGEGGEFETLVLDGPHMDAPVSIEATRNWDGDRGQLTVTAARRGTPGEPATLTLTDRS